MWITGFFPHIWMQFIRFTLDLWLAALPKLYSPCGVLLDKLSTVSVHGFGLFSIFPYFGFSSTYPPNVGGTLLKVVRRFDLQKPMLSTGQGTFPQITGTYPQFRLVGDVDLSEQTAQDMGYGRDISDS